MPTLDEHLADINGAFDAYMTELRQSPAALWETKPSGAAEGEEAWSARQVAEHLAGAATFFGAGIAMFVQVPGPERAAASYPTVDEAVKGTPEAHEKLLSVVRNIPPEKLAMEIEAPRLGKNTVSGFLGIIAHHLRDHAGQLKTLRG